MSYFQNKAQQNSKQSQQQMQQKPEKKVLEKDQQTIDKEQGRVLSFTEDEIVFIENVMEELQNMIPNEQGENSEILEKIVLVSQIVGSRLDSNAGIIGDASA